MKLFGFYITSLFVAIASALNIQGKIIPNAVLEDVSKIDSSTTRIVLNGAQYTAHIQSNGEFNIPHVQPGSYLLEVQSIEHVYPKIRVDISEENQVQAAYTGLGIDWNQRGYSVVYPLEIQAKAEAEYFMQRQGFNIMGMFKNPMMLMMGFSAIMMFFMPKMMKSLQNMDPEAANEISKSQADAQKMLSDMPSLSQMFAKR
ncbi:secreted salivary protein [Mucor ambiguus]|uniref:Secreted salivary protein n=1 Tax=Mucor ambiguus TaxID=91626 RepID=A0A0C9MAY9_9FUNG|nr:secreted salivary protein [Mucor ambiguus]